MAIARVQWGGNGASTAKTTTGATALNPTWGAATTAGNLLVMILGVNNPTTAVTWTITGGGWTLAQDQNVGSVSGVRIYYAENASSRSSETVSISSARDMWCVLIEYSGCATSSSADVGTGTNSASGTNVASGTSGATSQADEVIVGATANINTNTTSSDAMGGSATGGTFTKVNEVTSGNATAAQKITGRWYEQIVTGTGTAEVHGTIGAARSNSGCVQTFKAAGGGGGAPVFPQLIMPDLALYPA